jgi:hypothetical protein
MRLNRTETFASFELANALPGPHSTDEAIAGFAELALARFGTGAFAGP